MEYVEWNGRPKIKIIMYQRENIMIENAGFRLIHFISFHCGSEKQPWNEGYEAQLIQLTIRLKWFFFVFCFRFAFNEYLRSLTCLSSLWTWIFEQKSWKTSKMGGKHAVATNSHYKPHIIQWDHLCIVSRFPVSHHLKCHQQSI